MNHANFALTRALAKTASHDVRAQAQRLLGAANANAVAGKQPRLVKALEVKALWSARLANTDTTGQSLKGAKSLIRNLGPIRPQTTVEQFSFAGPSKTGILFFNHDTGSFIGSVVVTTAS